MAKRESLDPASQIRRVVAVGRLDRYNHDEILRHSLPAKLLAVILSHFGVFSGHLEWLIMP